MDLFSAIKEDLSYKRHWKQDQLWANIFRNFGNLFREKLKFGPFREYEKEWAQRKANLSHDGNQKVSRRYFK